MNLVISSKHMKKLPSEGYFHYVHNTQMSTLEIDMKNSLLLCG